jgi:PAS domain S-box-containing protein
MHFGTSNAPARFFENHSCEQQFPKGVRPWQYSLRLRRNPERVTLDISQEGTQSEERFRLLVHSVKDYAIFLLDREGRIASWNEGARLIKGYNPDEIIGRHFSVFYPSKAVESGFPQYELKVASETGRFEDEGWRIRKDGSRFWANVVITALRAENGELVGFAKVTRDLTERRKAENRLRESEERFRLLVQSVKDYAIFMLDVEGRVASWNEGAERIKGYSAGEILGKHFSIFYLPDAVAAAFPQYELKVAKETGHFEHEGWRVRKDGSQFWANVVITAVRDEEGILVGFAKVTRDLTARRAAEEQARRLAAEEAARAEADRVNALLQEQATELEQQTEEAQALTEELEQTNEELQRSLHETEEARDAARIAAKSADEANRAKAEFLRVMSHELRTPLNAIAGYAELLNVGVYGPMTDTQRDALARIERSQRHLLSLINDVLNFARLEAGRVEVSLTPVLVREVVLGLEALVAPQLRAKDLQYVVATAGGQVTSEPISEDLLVFADHDKLEQILLNLLSNAIKFTPTAGTITVGAHTLGDTVAIWVSDTGIGIPADKLETVFEPFVQIGRTPDSGHEGTGLGLAICRDLARAMKGELSVRSDAGAGSTFTLILPRASRA